MSPTGRLRYVATHGLRSIDASTIRLFLSFAGKQTRDSWQSSELSEAELVFVPAGGALPSEAALSASGVWVGALPVNSPTMPAAFEPLQRLTQPLQLEAFIELLRLQELADSPPAAANPAVAPVASRPVAVPPARPAPRAAAPIPPPPPVVAPSSAAESKQRATRDPRGRFRLKRWPSARSLARHRYLPRLASFLSARHLSALELAALSNVSALECEVFLDDMAAQGILEQRGSGPALVLPPAPQSPPVQDQGPDTVPEFRALEAPPPREKPLGGLMQRLRSRLGLLGRQDD